MSKFSRVVIVGRVNVGKSTLFNRFSDKSRSLTYDQPGVTRDFISDVICWRDKCFEIIDSGGISLAKQQDSILSSVQKNVLGLVESADIIIFMCDGTTGPTLEDQAISKFLHKLNKKVFLAINKSDAKRTQDFLYEFQQLGWKESFLISAQHGISTSDILDEIVDTLPDEVKTKDGLKTEYNVTILGKPNVGKSSLMNILLKQERSLVTEQAGTTREAVSGDIHFYKETLKLTDTPGIRRKKTIKEPLEKLMVKSSFSALFDADIAVLMIDVSEGRISDQELKLAFYAFEQ